MSHALGLRRKTNFTRTLPTPTWITVLELSPTSTFYRTKTCRHLHYCQSQTTRPSWKQLSSSLPHIRTRQGTTKEAVKAHVHRAAALTTLKAKAKARAKALAGLAALAGGPLQTIANTIKISGLPIAHCLAVRLTPAWGLSLSCPVCGLCPSCLFAWMLPTLDSRVITFLRIGCSFSLR